MMVNIGKVQTFPDVRTDKAQALKVLEEASEVHAAWKQWDEWDRGEITDGMRNGVVQAMSRFSRERVLEECADVVQAVCNLVAALGVEDFRPYMKACERRNRERGRITDGRAE